MVRPVLVQHVDGVQEWEIVKTAIAGGGWTVGHVIKLKGAEEPAAVGAGGLEGEQALAHRDRLQGAVPFKGRLVLQEWRAGDADVPVGSEGVSLQASHSLNTPNI